MEGELNLEELTEQEMEVVMTVFRSYETGLREATIYPKDLHNAMKMLGLNPMEQEIIDLTNNISRNGFIYFPEFCRAVHERMRADDEEVFRQNMFKMLCGTEPFPETFRAKKYKLHSNFFTKKDFFHVMLNLPVEVSEVDIEEMFTYADQDRDGRISYDEFQTMINPPKPPEPPKPTMADLTGLRQQQQDPPATLSVTTMLATTPAQFSANNGTNSYGANNGTNSYANHNGTTNLYANHNGANNSYVNHGGANRSSAASNSNQWSTERQVTAT